jgi:Bacterial membrane protein YfhO
VRPIARADRLAGAALFLLAVVLFRESLLEGGVFYKRDLHLIWHPQVEGFVRAVASGDLPLWDPSPAFGQPLLADALAQALYPPTWLNLVLPAWLDYTVYAFGHVLFSGLAFLALARRWRLSPGAALAGAAAWVLSGPFLSLVDLWHHFASACWIPAVFLAAERAIEGRGARDVLVLGLAIGMQVLAGSADVCAMTLVALAVWVAIAHVEGSRLRSALPLVVGGALALAVGALLSSGLWLATLDVVWRSSRRELPEAVRTYWSAHPASLLEMLLVGVPGRLPLSTAWRAALFEGREPLLASLYLGLPAAGLVAAAFAVPGVGGRRRWALAAVGLGAIAVALGRHAPVYDAVTAVLPPLRLFRFPVKAMVLVAFAWAGLVALGAEAWGKAAPGRRWLGTVVVPLAVLAGVAAWSAFTLATGRPPWGTLLGERELVPKATLVVARGLGREAALAVVALALAVWRGRTGRRASALAALAAVAAIADLALAHPRPNPTAPRALYTTRPQALAALDDPARARVYSYDYTEPGQAQKRLGRPVAHVLERLPEGWRPDAAIALGLQLSLAPQTAGRWGVRQAFDIDYRGLQAGPLAGLTRLVRIVEDRPDDVLRLLQVGAVTHVIALHRVAGNRLRPVAEIPSFFPDPIRVEAVPEPLPRVYAVAGVRVADGMAALAALVDPAFDPRREVVLPQGPPATAPDGFRGEARVVRESACRVRLDAELPADGYVVLVDGYDPGWRARLDGRPVPLLRANVAFRAVAVPAGRHTVEMAYRPTAALAGLAVSGVTSLGLVGAFASFLVNRRATRAATPRTARR